MFDLNFSLLTKPVSEGLISRKTRENFLDYELFEELEPYLNSLKEHALISGAREPFRKTSICLVDGFKVPVFRLVYQFEGLRFKLSYSVDPDMRVVMIESFDIKKIVDMNAVREFLSKQLSCKDFLGDLPQADRPTDIIKVIEFVYVGHHDSLEVGKLLGHKCVKPHDVRRHGCYKLNAAINLGLIERYRLDRKHYYRVTEKGQKIAALGTKNNGSGIRVIDAGNKDISTQYRLMIEAMLGYYPVRLIFDEIIQPQKGLSVEEIQRYIDTRIKPSYHSSKTSYRRAQCLMTWLHWMTMVSGISVFRKDSEDAQMVLKLFPEIKINEDL